MKFKEFILNNENSRKVFGEKELLIIKKQIEGVNLSQSEKNRLSRDIRPKLKFIREASRFDSEFELKKGSENKKIIEETLEIIKCDIDFEKVSEVWLFGSVVKNEMSVRSDIDFAILLDKTNKREATKFRIRISSNASDKADIQIFDFLDEKIKRSILKNHKVLYKRDGK